MADSKPNPEPNVEGLTYFADFIRLLERDYAWASVESVVQDIEFYRDFAPARARLERRDGGVFILKSVIGRGHYAIVELEFDIDGILQPVMGGFLRT